MVMIPKFNVFAPIVEKLSIEGREVYKVIMPSGLTTLVWCEDCFVV